MAKCWDANLYLVLQSAVVLPTVPWKSLEFLTNLSEIMESYGLRDSDILLEKFLSSPNCLDHSLKIKIVGENTLIKNGPTE